MDTLKDGTILDKDQTKAYNPERLKTKDRKMVSFREQKRLIPRPQNKSDLQAGQRRLLRCMLRSG